MVASPAASSPAALWPGSPAAGSNCSADTVALPTRSSRPVIVAPVDQIFIRLGQFGDETAHGGQLLFGRLPASPLVVPENTADEVEAPGLQATLLERAAETVGAFITSGQVLCSRTSWDTRC